MTQQVTSLRRTKRLGIDIGGTFTDLVLYDSESKRIARHKLLTTPDNPAEAVLAGMQQILEDTASLPEEVDEMTYATTVATNAVLERKGPRVALITTEGFRDVLLIQRQSRYDLFDLFIDKPLPLLRRRDIHTVKERLTSAGVTHVALDVAGSRRLATKLRGEGVESVAISLLHAYRDGRHEEQVADIFAEVHPDCYLSLSSAVSPIIGEYERTNTTVTDAYVKPATIKHLEVLEAGISQMGISASLTVMLSDGGLAPVDRATDVPVRMIESGPAAGAEIAAYIGRNVGSNDVIGFDMGGTTAKVVLIEDGRPTLSDELEVDRIRMIPGSGLPLKAPSVDLIEIGTGGGSIASVDGTVIRVGPESSGASPGPAAYGRGGDRATVTDADLLLGYLNPDFFLGGRMQLDTGAARKAIARDVAEPLRIDAHAAARGIYEVINGSMEQAIRAGTVQRGRDPRVYSLVATGGAAPVHATAIARSLGIRRVVCPPASGVASALGLLAAERRTSLARSLLVRLDDPNFSKLAKEQFALLEQDAERAFGKKLRSDQRLVFRRSISVRYVGQGYSLDIPYSDGGNGSLNVEVVVEGFHEAYEQLYGRSERDTPAEITTWRLDAVLPTPSLTLEERQVEAAASSPAKLRAIYDIAAGEFQEATVHRFDILGAGAQITGPAVIEQSESTIVIFAGDRAEIDAHGNVIVSVGKEGG